MERDDKNTICAQYKTQHALQSSSTTTPVWGSGWAWRGACISGEARDQLTHASGDLGEMEGSAL